MPSSVALMVRWLSTAGCTCGVRRAQTGAARIRAEQELELSVQLDRHTPGAPRAQRRRSSARDTGA